MTRSDDRPNLLVLGSDQGWHAEQLRVAATDAGCRMSFAPYESLRGDVISAAAAGLRCSAGSLGDFNAVITRTMPAASFEQITFRLATLHEHVRAGGCVINPPRALEIAIDKFATLAIVASLGYDVPATRVVQSREEALDAFGALGGDCVVKPIFGGEGRGVMRVRDRELAWYTFSTLERLGAICYVQAFIAPGGRDTRLLVIGEQVHAVRRINSLDFRTNVAGGGQCTAIEATDEQRSLARRITDAIGLPFASVDVIDADDGAPRVVEVNGIPGWRGAQQVLSMNIASAVIDCVAREAKVGLRELLHE